jgi:CBS domain-containing protein
MEPDVPLLPADHSVESAWRLAQSNGGPAHVVGTRQEVVGLLSSECLARTVSAGRGDQPLRSLVEGPIIHVHGDHPLDVVLDRLAQSDGLLPVLSREHARRLEGAITMDSIVRYIHRRRAGSARTGEA